MAELDPGRALAHEDLCRFLAACYYEPCAEFGEEKLFDSMLAAASQIDPELADLARQLGEDFAAEELQTLLVDYARLFLGPGEVLARPYGSFWLSGDKTVMQESTLAVLDLYQQGGFDLDEGFMEVPDHVAVELEFLYLLTFQRHQAQLAGQEEARLAAEQLQARFLGEHLGVWIDSFSAALEAGAETAFYRHLAQLTRRFVGMQREGLEGRRA